MATATIARPTGALRRRDVPRLTVGKRQANMDSISEPASKKRKPEPYVRTHEYILQKHSGKPPSLVIHLHPTYFKFDGQDGSFTYDSEMKFILEHLKRNTVPHQMMEELLSNNVTFYDGCLIVEVHNHRSQAGGHNGRKDSRQDDAVKFSMHNYNPHITPSPMVPFPSKAARIDETPEKPDGNNDNMPAPEKQKEKDGPRIATIVLHPTELTQHREIILLANTPVSEFRNKKRATDLATPSSAQPATPQLSVPPTPIGQSSRNLSPQSQRMCLEENDLYAFQADLLVATQPPLYLEPVSNPQDAQKVLDMLQHPLHRQKPPSPKTRKRTTAEVAADDAQQQETERRMLIMDERIKPSGAGAAANETQGAASSLGFSRFKTIDMVRQKIEENERARKEEEFRASAEKKQQEEHALQQRAHQQKQQQLVAASQQQSQQQMLMEQRRQHHKALQQAQAQQQQQQQQQQAQVHAHPQPNAAMMQNQLQTLQQQTLQQQHGNQASSIAQSSPIVRQQTPMMNGSSPMMPQGGFAMVPTSSQGAGSPPRPTSGMQHPMARQMSQQQGSRNATPQISQSTPHMVNAMPNRQMTQTPRMPPGSPAVSMQQGTPTSIAMGPTSTHHMSNAGQFTPEQLALLHQQQQQAQQRAMSVNANGQGGSPLNPNMMPEQFQNVQQQHQQRMSQMQALQNQVMQHSHGAQQARAQGNPQLAQQLHLKAQQLNQRYRHIAQQMQMQQGSPMPGGGHAGSPGVQHMPQQTPQMGHAHPQQSPHPGQQVNMGQDPNQQQNLTPQQQQIQTAQAQQRAQQLAQMRAHQQRVTAQAQQQVAPLVAQYGGLQNIPPNVVAGLPPAVQQLMQRQINNMQQQQYARARAQQQGQIQTSGGPEQVPAAPANPQYMQQLRNQQALLAQHQAQIQSQQNAAGGMNGMGGMSFQMNGINNSDGNDLAPRFAAMQDALNRGSTL